jgi:hypothetical protein
LVVLGVLGALGVLGVEPMLPEPLVLPDPVLPEPMLPEPEVLPEPLLPDPRLPDPVLPEPLVLPYCFTQSVRSVPVLPMHWLGVAALSLLVLPVAPELVEPEVLESELVEPDELEPAPALPPVLPLPLTLGLVVELPLLPEVCAQVTVARPRRAAATAALSCFAITMVLSFGWGEDCRPRHASGMPRLGMRTADSPRGSA